MADRAFGVTIRVNWTSSPQIGGLLDASWEASALAVPQPKGKWWGPWIALAGKPATEGESVYDRTRKEIVLWVPFQVEGITARFLLMGLNGFDFPPQHGSSGSGNLYPLFGFRPPKARLTSPGKWSEVSRPVGLFFGS